MFAAVNKKDLTQLKTILLVEGDHIRWKDYIMKQSGDSVLHISARCGAHEILR